MKMLMIGIDGVMLVTTLVMVLRFMFTVNVPMFLLSLILFYLIRMEIRKEFIEMLNDPNFNDNDDETKKG